jgi:hypothetical protein
MKLWNQFNTAWLGISQMQREMLESHQQTRFPQSLMTRDFIKEMVNDLHGFVMALLNTAWLITSMVLRKTILQ